jgi:uncharacterized protein RhaS with RHS repeats
VGFIGQNYYYTYNIWGIDNIGQVVYRYPGANRYYYLKDHLGSIRMTVDASGNVVGYNDYYPFGMTMPARSMTSSADGRYQFCLSRVLSKKITAC